MLVLGQNPLQLSQTQSFIFEFFLLRGIHVIPRTMPVYVYDGFIFVSGFFYPGPSRVFMARVSKSTLSAHKRVLKVIVKSSILISPSILIQKLNKQIILWRNSYKEFDYFWLTCLDLDRYLARLLWKWVKRRHGGVPCIVLYHHYWRKVEGNKLVFFYLDQRIGRSYTLLFHV